MCGRPHAGCLDFVFSVNLTRMNHQNICMIGLKKLQCVVGLMEGGPGEWPATARACDVKPDLALEVNAMVKQAQKTT